MSIPTDGTFVSRTASYKRESVQQYELGNTDRTDACL